MTNTTRETARGIIIRDNQLLLIRRTRQNSQGGIDTWLSIPGGALDPGETPEQAVVRELKEELGISVSIVRFLSAQDVSSETARHNYFLCTILEGQPRIVEDSEEYERMQSGTPNTYAVEWTDLNSPNLPNQLYWAYKEAYTQFADNVRAPQGESPRAADSNPREFLDVLRAVAQEGLSYSQNEYDAARYEKLLDLAAREYEVTLGIPKEEAKVLFLKEQGSITPKLGVDSAVVNDKGQVLVLKRGDGSWGMPGGWADVGESPFETAERETFEETGLRVKPVGYIAITYKTPKAYPGFASQVNICVAVEPVSDDQKITLSHEHSDYMWIDSIDQVTEWHAGQRRLFPRIFDAYRDKDFIPNIE